MPNWCSSTIYFYTKEKNVIEEFKNKVEEIYNGTATVKNGFGSGWLGDYVNTLLDPEYHADTEKGPRCRGSLELYDELAIEEQGEYWCFHIYTETAWYPMIKMWQMILDKHYPQIKIAFRAEESGDDIYVRHDPENLFFEFDNFFVLYDIGDYGSHCFDSLGDVLDHIIGIKELGLTGGEFEGKTAKEIAEIASEKAWLMIHEFEHVELNEVD